MYLSSKPLLLALCRFFKVRRENQLNVVVLFVFYAFGLM